MREVQIRRNKLTKQVTQPPTYHNAHQVHTYTNTNTQEWKCKFLHFFLSRASLIHRPLDSWMDRRTKPFIDSQIRVLIKRVQHRATCHLSSNLGHCELRLTILFVEFSSHLAPEVNRTRAVTI